MPHSIEVVAILLLLVAGAGGLVIWATIGVVLLITNPVQRTLIAYSAVVLALIVCLLVFAPGSLLRVPFPILW